jgi:hypothetical protein
MESRWFNTVVVVFWATTMGWLFVTKILPPLRKGEPPNYLSVLAAEQSEPAEVRWRILWNDRAAGYATHKVVRLRTGDAEIHSSVQFDHLPLEDLVPSLLHNQINQALGADAPLQLSWKSRLSIDAIGRLTGFRSDVRIDDLAVMTLDGAVEGTKLQVKASVASGDPLTTSFRLPNDALMGDAVSPQSFLPGLRLGQEWTVPVFNPLRPDSAIEVLQATVPCDDWIVWNGEPIEARIVEIRSDPGSTPEVDTPVRTKLWVAPTGKVLKQEVRILHSTIAFERIPDDGKPVRLRQSPAEIPAAARHD